MFELFFTAKLLSFTAKFMFFTVKPFFPNSFCSGQQGLGKSGSTKTTGAFAGVIWVLEGFINGIMEAIDSDCVIQVGAGGGIYQCIEWAKRLPVHDRSRRYD